MKPMVILLEFNINAVDILIGWYKIVSYNYLELDISDPGLRNLTLWMLFQGLYSR